MNLQETAAFVSNVFVIFVLGIIYVAGLTLGTVVAAVRALIAALSPFTDQERDRPTL